jgi:flagellar biosynthesis anti-sigma factor FlgM
MIDRIPPNVPAGYTNNARLDNKTGEILSNNRPVDNSSAQVSLSDDALALQRLLQAVEDVPDVREEVVQEIKSQIEAGTYRVDFDRLTEQLLRLF